MNVFESIAAVGQADHRPRNLLERIGALLSPERADIAEALSGVRRPVEPATRSGQEYNHARR